MADIKAKYPAADTVAITISLASLASSTSWAGRASTAINNTTNLDLDHLVSGVIKLGTTPTAAKRVSVYVYAPLKIVSGTPTYPDGITGTDANKTMTSESVAIAALRWLWTGKTDATTGLVLPMPQCSIADAFGGMPPYWGLFVVHDSVAALDATAGNHYFHYFRQQAQSV